jgi:hypothetical protein
VSKFANQSVTNSTRHQLSSDTNMPPNGITDVALMGVCRLIVALWELVVAKAQPYPICSVLKTRETEHNRRWRRWEAKQVRLGRQAPKSNHRWKQNPNIEKVMGGFALRPKYNAVWELRIDRKRTAGYGRGYPIPDGVPLALHRPVLMFRQCDSSNFVMKPLLTKLLHNIDPNYRVEWFVVIPAPRIQVRLEGGDLATAHSVFLITAPSGTKTVLDLTGEQFGIDPQELISPLPVYLHKHVAKASEWSSARYTCNTDRYERSLERCMEELEQDGNKFWSTARHLVDGLFEGWEDEMKTRELGEADAASRREWMEVMLALEIKWLNKD